MFKCILRFLIDIVIALIVILAILFGTKTNVSLITTNVPNYNLNLQTPNVVTEEIVAADMINDVDEVIGIEETVK